jgi:integrase
VNRPKTTGKHLPPRMLERRKTLKSGKVWTGYYYAGRTPDGKRQEIPLGTDLAAAKTKWAELERKPPPAGAKSRMQMAWEKYLLSAMPKKDPKTRKQQLTEAKRLQAYFAGAEFEQITSAHIAQYRDGRRSAPRTRKDGTLIAPSKPAPVAANRELALFSHFWNLSRELGYTNAPNPVRGVTKNDETPRDFYADPELWAAVREQAVPELQDALDLAYLTGQRPGDVLRFERRHIVDDALELRQGKTKKKLRIMLTDAETGTRSQLGLLVDRLGSRKVLSAWLIATPSGQPMSLGMMRNRFNAARIAAAAAHPHLADRIKAFQFRDSRAKAASEIEDLKEAQKLLAHSSEQITKIVYRRVGEKVKPTR